MNLLWRKLCGLALGVALLPSLAGGGACLEHAAHSLVGAETVVAVENDAHLAHSAKVAHRAHAAHGAAAENGAAVEAHAQHAHSATGETSIALSVDQHVPSNAHQHVASNAHQHVPSNAHQHVASNAHQHVAAGKVSSAPGGNCCPPMGSPDHCAGAAGCGGSAIAIAVDLAAQHAVASRVIALAGALAPPGPARVPDVPPPRV